MKTLEDITEEELIALEHRPGDGRKMYADTALYRLTTLDENPDADNQRRPGTLRGEAATIIREAGGVVAGRVLHYHMLLQTSLGKWDHGYIHMVSNKNLVKRGASRDWLRRVDGQSLGQVPSAGKLPVRATRMERAPSRAVTAAASPKPEQTNLILQRLTLPTALVEARGNPRLLAYRSAERTGARFVALQNAEHVWLWDRWAGRTYEEQFAGRFVVDDFEAAFAKLAGAGRTPALPPSGLEDGSAVWALADFQDRLADLVRGVALLRADPDHVERAHERLVDHFLIRLGFDAYSEIGFRNGRIDMTVQISGSPRLAFEVKRNWRLQEHGVLDQAYNYALEHGIRFFAITNGDDYIFHDCWRSLTRHENELGRFRISALREADVPILEWLRTKRFALS
jgi:glutathione S-transferase